METKTKSILSGWTVRDMMRREVVTVLSTMSVPALASFLSDQGISGAPVIDTSDNVVGVVSQSDIVRAVAKRVRAKPGVQEGPVRLETNGHANGEGDVSSFFHRTDGELHQGLASMAMLPLRTMTVGDIMMPARFTVRPTTSLAGLAQYLVTAKVHRALVMEDGALLGIVTTFDVLQAIAASEVAG